MLTFINFFYQLPLAVLMVLLVLVFLVPAMLLRVLVIAVGFAWSLAGKMLGVD